MKIVILIIIIILDIHFGTYTQKYILLLSVIHSQPTHTLVICNQATGFTSVNHHQAMTETFEN
jgi:hypothetical protein